MDFRLSERWRKRARKVRSGKPKKRHPRRSCYKNLRGLESLERRSLLASVFHPVVVSEDPADTTPHIVLDGSQKMRAFEQIGRTMYAGGKFDEVRDPTMTTTYPRDNFFAFDADTGEILPLNLSFNGTVTAIEATADETALFISGSFSEVNGIDRRGIIKYDLVNDQIDLSFAPERMRTVSDMQLLNGSLIIAGSFRKHLLAVDPNTGEDLGTIDINVDGTVDSGEDTKVRRIAISPDGTRLVATGNFETVNGQFRERAFMVNLGETATLSTWYAPRFDVNCDRSSKRISAQGVDFSPDGSYFVIVANGGNGLDGICDAAARFETENVSSTVEPTWINWAGGDTLWSVAITDAAVYVGGHQRWLDNRDGDDEAGPGAVSRPGIGAIDPVTGKALEWNPTKSRNEGTRVLFLTPEGLWVGSDGERFADEEHHGIAFVPLELEPTNDTTPPETLIDSGPSGSVENTSATFSFSASEPSTFRCRLDTASFIPCTSPMTYQNLSVGSHTLQVVAVNESYLVDETPAERTWTVSGTGHQQGFGSWSGRIASSFDDAEEKSSGGIKLSSSDLELIQDRSDPQVVGLRFTDVNVPPGATIQNAYIQFQADETNSDPTTLTIFGEAVDNASTFTTSNGNITSRPTTSASVAWSPTPWTTTGRAGPDEQTPNIATVIQEIVSRPGWSSQNALAIIINGTGERVAESVDGNRSAAAKLHVEYYLGNLPPTTSGIADVNVNTDAPNTVINLMDAFEDSDDPDPALTFSIEDITNSSLFEATAIDSLLGTLTLDYVDGTNDTADITIRATDTGDPALFVETTFTVTVAPVNQPPTTTGIVDVMASEGASDTTIDLFAAFDDPDGLDSEFTFSVEANTNSDLFTSTDIHGALGRLTLDYAPDANGTADITVRATDAGIPVHSVETTFTVDLSEFNSTPVLSSGSVDHLTVVRDSPATSLGLEGLVYEPGAGVDESSQTLRYTVTSVPSSKGDVILSNGTTVVTPGDYTLDQIRGMQFLAAPGVFGGPETFSFTVSDNGTTNGVADFKTLSQSLEINVIKAIPIPIIVDVQIATSTDDAEEKSTGGIKLGSSDLELIQDKSDRQVVGLRFTGVNIPPGSTIQNAYIQFQADERNSDPTTLTIFGEAVDNASTFTTTNGNITSRPTTSASVAWSPTPWTTTGRAGPDEQTPNIATVIQEIVSRPGWSDHNALAIIINGTGERVAESIDGNRDGAARLHVEYLLGNRAPTTSGIADVKVNTDAPNTVINLMDAFEDAEDPDLDLTYSIQNNNPSLFDATAIDSLLGTLTLDYAAGTNDTADITIRATDTGDPALFVETTFTVTVVPVNQPPTTTGIVDVMATEGDGDTTINLFAAFDDPDGLDSEFTFSVEANTNSDLFTSTVINDALGRLTLDYAPDANGTADITVRATDAGLPVRWVESTFNVDLAEFNSTPVRSSGSVDHLTVVQNSPVTSLGLEQVGYEPGAGADESSQTLSYSVTSVPSSLGTVILSNGTTVVTPGDYTLDQIQGMQFFAAPGVFGGPETFSFTVTDNGTTSGAADFKTLNQSLEINVTETIPDPILVDAQIASSTDDAEEKATGGIRIDSSDLELIQDRSVQQVVGMRFTGLNIPPGATIQNAYIQFQANRRTSDPTALTISGEAVDHALTFASINGNITSRPTTAASVSWSPAPWTTTGRAGPDEQTPNIATVIQEIVDRPGWSSENALAIIINGSGKRAAESFDGNQGAAARLHVEYLPGPPE